MAETSRHEGESEPQPEEISPEEAERRRREQEWQDAKNPSQMVHNPDYNPIFEDNPRKSRLFLVECLKSVSSFLPNNTIDLAEKYADNLITPEELLSARLSVEPQHRDDDREVPFYIAQDYFREQVYLENVSVSAARVSTRNSVHPSKMLREGKEVEAKKREEQADMIRDIFGNPYAKEQPKILDSWRTPTVTGLANTIYEGKVFDRMPILADALEDAGCQNLEILNHCRSTDCAHVRGCWLVDLILQKE